MTNSGAETTPPEAPRPPILLRRITPEREAELRAQQDPDEPKVYVRRVLSDEIIQKLTEANDE